ncbi:methylase involved in ubiquinone/menaquinone biosynthesis [Frankia casuarinae]|jgi:tRNA (cmo5U34)-methyltransferase|uniref:Methyltransferase type 12 n=2 Tax=Frankia TaxID=1854 RepID=Q2JCS6_FRACC|nr:MULTISPECIES: class I SAM-dependent methyltransferase [unclassified Frankia]ABD10916.1 Methyltransferase type 12 [Frankia casuarinae]KEZ37566.1 methylase involved in ubiquinone/menaquinone biosynthesis [Frankia sp. CeD]OFB45212.1 methyltransferase type 12 [Frankia sp. CgIM4]TFE30497.1 class I SAM-dependent methyltransferase [Frankia sp. B2]ETA02233.1 methylase involved in ubiquinone/menaquinone biosynthesis [Frankia sp. CcI6]
MNEMPISYYETPSWDPGTYDGERRRLVPSFDLLYGSVGDLVARQGGARPAVLDLGAGTGLLAAAVVAAVPDVRLHLFDRAAPMLAKAQARLSGGPVEAVTVADLASALPPGPFNAVVSALAIHHLDDPGKRDLFRRVRDVLRPGGLFVNLEQVNGPTAALTRQYEDMHERQARAAGSDDAEWEAALRRMSFDRCAPLADQLDWLADAGFAPVDCVVKHGRFAVYAGWRP